MSVHSRLAQSNTYEPKGSDSLNFITPPLGNIEAKIIKTKIEESKVNKILQLVVLYKTSEGAFSDRMDIEGNYLGKAHVFIKRVAEVDEFLFTDIPEMIEKGEFKKKVKLAIVAGKNAKYPKIFVNRVIHDEMVIPSNVKEVAEQFDAKIVDDIDDMPF